MFGVEGRYVYPVFIKKPLEEGFFWGRREGGKAAFWLEFLDGQQVLVLILPQIVQLVVPFPLGLNDKF